MAPRDGMEFSQSDVCTLRSDVTRRQGQPISLNAVAKRWNPLALSSFRSDAQSFEPVQSFYAGFAGIGAGRRTHCLSKNGSTVQ